MKKALIDREKVTGKRSPKLDAVKVPPGFDYLFRMFWDVRGGATEGMGGVRITWHDLVAYQALHGFEIGPFEVDAIMAMDEAAAEAITAARKSE